MSSYNRNTSKIGLLLVVGFLLSSVFYITLLSYPTREGAVIMVIFYFLIVIASTFAISFDAIKGKCIAIFVFYVGNLYWFALPAIKVIITGNWYGVDSGNRISDDIVIYTCFNLYIFLFMAQLIYFANIRIKKANDQNFASTRINNDGLYKRKLSLGLITITLLIFGIVPIFAISGWGGFVSTLVSSRSGEGLSGSAHAVFQSNPFLVISRSFLVTAGIISFWQLLERKAKNKLLIWLPIFLIAFIISYFDSGTRTWTGIIILPSLILFYKISVVKISRRKTIFLTLVCVLTLLWLVDLQERYRYTGFSWDTFKPFADDVGVRFEKENSNDFFTETAIAIMLVPGKIPYQFESSFMLHLVNPIPRTFWKEKPYSRIIEMYTIGRSGKNEYLLSGTSRLPSVVGQSHMSAGVIDVIFTGLLFGMLIKWIDTKWGRTSCYMFDLWASLICVWMFFTFRFLNAGFHYPIIILGLIVAYINQYSIFSHRNRQPSINR